MRLDKTVSPDDSATRFEETVRRDGQGAWSAIWLAVSSNRPVEASSIYIYIYIHILYINTCMYVCMFTSYLNVYVYIRIYIRRCAICLDNVEIN